MKQRSLLKDIRTASLIGILIATIITFITSWYLMSTFFQLERDSSINTLGNSLLKSISRSLTQGNYASVQTEISHKGFPEFINSIEIISREKEILAEVNLKSNECGSVVSKDFDIVVPENIFQSINNGVNYGKIRITTNNCDIKDKKRNLLIVIFIVMFLSILLLFLFFKKILENSISNLNKIVEKAGSKDTILNKKELLENSPKEISPLIRKLIKETEKSAKVSLAEKVAHDIISPTLALSNLISMKRSELGEDNYSYLKKNITRIIDISNNLKASSSQSEKSNVEEFFLDLTIDYMLSEKRVQFHRKPVIIKENEDESNKGNFVCCSKSFFQRILSNIINNSVEAFVDGKGTIILKTYRDERYCYISIMDNGPGIPSQIVRKMFRKDFSTKKSSGIGLSSAKEYLDEIGGDITYNKLEGEFGTEFIIKIPRVQSPTWYISSKNLCGYSQVVIVDDERYSYEIIRKKLIESMDIIYLESIHAFENYMLNNDVRDSFFVFDYHFTESNENGLQMIKKHGISQNSILVTSQADSISLQKKCEKLKVKLLSKTLLESFVFFNKEILNELKKSIIILDDDELMYLHWKFVFEKKNFSNYHIYSNPEQLLDELEHFHKDSIFILDYSLNRDDINGCIVGKKIKSNGFNHIYMSSGYDNMDEFSEFSGVLPKGDESVYQSKLDQLISKVTKS